MKILDRYIIKTLLFYTLGVMVVIVFDLGVPILGICYGMQTMATQLGGQATSADKHEYGFAKVQILDRYIIKTLLFYTLGVMVVWMGVYALFNFINEINLIGQHNYTTLSAIIYVAADLPAVIYSHSSVIILLGCLLGMGHLAAPP
jgi:lipopolysaccharide export LptBFGC system permease protein LptF